MPEKYEFLAIMPVALKDQAIEDTFHGANSKAARAVYPQTSWHIAARKLDPLDSAQSLEELKVPSGLDIFQGKSRSQEPH
ncbi:MAG: plasmid maintenance system killer protein [Dehalococcoidia bacterium]|nr:plasmid maintenance system killer protein [Dehalococcoidia bacterium]